MEVLEGFEPPTVRQSSAALSGAEYKPDALPLSYRTVISVEDSYLTVEFRNELTTLLAGLLRFSLFSIRQLEERLSSVFCFPFHWLSNVFQTENFLFLFDG